MNNRVLIIDDEPAIARVLKPVLTAAGFAVFTAETAVAGMREASQQAVDLILLDLGLPDIDGKQIISKLRSSGRLAIIVVSARHQEAEKVAALDAGADDYVDKPFNIGELMARLRSAQRRLRLGNLQLDRFESSQLTIDFLQRKVLLLGDEIKLSPKEFDLLRMLAEYEGQVVTHRRLLVAGWGDPDQDPQYLRSYIALLRQKIEEDPAEPRILMTEPGVGYRLNVD